MSKGTTPRHSKSPEPVTIDLDATDVTPRDEYPKPSGSAAEKPATQDPKIAAQAAMAADAAGTDKPSSTTEPATGKDAPDASGKPEPDLMSGKPDSTRPERPTADKLGEKPAVGKTGQGAAFGRNEPRATKAASSASGGLMTGLAGGAIAAVILYGLQLGGIIPAPADSTQSLANRITELDTRLSTLSSSVSVLPAGNDAAAALSTLSERVEAIEKQTADAAPAGDSSGLVGRVDDLAQRLDALGSGAGSTSGADPALVSDIATLKAQGSASQADLESLRTRLAAIESSLSSLVQKQAAADSAITVRLSDAEAQLAKPDANLDVARAIASVGLKSAIDRGGAFAAELDAFASVAPEDAAVGDLRPYAALGVPTRSALLAQFPDAADQMIAAMRPDQADAGILDRLVSSAMTMVKVRQVGDVEGDGVEAIVARMETRLTDGDLQGALAEFQSLPEPAQVAAKAFGDKLAARAEVDKLLATAVLPAVPATPAN